MGLRIKTNQNEKVENRRYEFVLLVGNGEYESGKNKDIGIIDNGDDERDSSESDWFLKTEWLLASSNNCWKKSAESESLLE